MRRVKLPRTTNRLTYVEGIAHVIIPSMGPGTVATARTVTKGTHTSKMVAKTLTNVMGEITARIKKFVLTIPEVIIVDASRGTIVTETEAHVSPINQLVHHPINEPVNHHWQLTSPLVLA